MAKFYDVIVIGAGHNGLTAAAFLAQAGRKVLVVEAREMVGGLIASEEFHPGYRSAGLLHDTTGLRPAVIDALALEHHGLRLRSHRPDLLTLGEDESLFLPGQVEEAAREIRKHSPKDGQAYLAYHDLIQRLRPAVVRFFDENPPDVIGMGSQDLWGLIRHGLRLRGLGKNEMLELLRIAPMCVADWLDEWFEHKLLKATMAFAAIEGTFSGPRSPGTNANLLLWECAAGPGVVDNGVGLCQALKAAAFARGVEIRRSARVEQIRVDSSGARGVTLSNGEELTASIVVSSCSPKQTFLELLPRGYVTHRVEEQISQVRTRGTTAQVLLALRQPPIFRAAPVDLKQPLEFVRIATSMTQMEQAFDAIKYRQFSDRPFLDIHIPSIASPSLAPKGHAVMSVLVHFAPYDLEGGWTEEKREQLGDRVVTILEPHIVDFRPSFVARRVYSPVDLACVYGLTQGNIHHGEHALDQRLIRPTPDCARYRTPIPGLFLCSGGSHPGGGLTAAPGALAALAVMQQKT